MPSKKMEVLHYTEKELAAIAALEANRGIAKTADELGVASATLLSIIKKANDEREIDNGPKYNIVKGTVEKEVVIVKPYVTYTLED